MRALRQCLWAFAATLLVLPVFAATAAPLTRSQALAALAQPEATDRLAGVARLAEIGIARDADRVLERLADAVPYVRAAASAAVWQIWSRSGDAGIDALFARGVEQMQASALVEALATFDEIVRRKPANTLCFSLAHRARRSRPKVTAMAP